MENEEEEEVIDTGNRGKKPDNYQIPYLFYL